MRSSVRLITFLLAVLFALTAFCGCNTNKPATESTEKTQAKTDAPTDAPTETEAATEPAPVPVIISPDNAGEYTIIRHEYASQSVKDAVSDFYKASTAKLGDKLAISDDWTKDAAKLPEKAHEIVIGQTNRPECNNLKKELRELDYAIIYKNDRIYIVGGNDDSTIEALGYFKDKYVDKETGKITVNDKLAFYHYHDYPIKKIDIDGINIRDYTVVIPDKCDLYTEYAAANLNDYLYTNAGFTLTTVSDKTVSTEYEILIGETNRAESKVSVTASEGQYIFVKTGKKVVCLGNSYMVGGGVSALIAATRSEDKKDTFNITGIPTTAKAYDFKFAEAKNAILMIGDGMGFNTVAMSLPTIGKFCGEDLPNRGQSITSSLNTLADATKPTDSAAGATALSTGYRTTNGYIGIDGKKATLLNVRELADSKGAMTAVLSTDKITGATPAGFLVHHDNRNDTDVIQAQIDAVIAAGKVDYSKGSIGNELTDTTAEALRKISYNNSSFFMMVEEGQIDKNSHNNNMTGCITMVGRFSNDIAYVIEFVLCHPDTALIITADHETGGITLNQSTGKYAYTLTSHSTANVPIYAIGAGTEAFNGKTVDNIQIAKFIAKIYGENNFGS